MSLRLSDSEAKALDAARQYAEQRSRRWRIMRGEGDGTTIYFGNYKGARFVGVQLRGFSGWSSRPAWMPGGWEFFNPTISTGRLFCDGPYRSWSREVRIPAKLWSFYYWKVKPSGRRYMREHGHEQPMEAER